MLNNIDPESDTAMEDMLTALDDLAAEFNTLAEIEVPRQFSAIENLADEAGDNMVPGGKPVPGSLWRRRI